MHTSLRPIEQPIADMSSYPGLDLANGLTWGLQAVDALSAEAVTSLAMIMQATHTPARAAASVAHRQHRERAVFHPALR